MASKILAEIILVVCLLYISTLTEASFSKVVSITGQVVERSVAAHVHRRVARNTPFDRFKREVLKRKLEDPKGCINQCRQTEGTQLVVSMMKNMARLVALALEDVKGDEHSTPEREAAFEKEIEKKTVANMGPLFDDLCSIQKNKSNCFSKCPESEARTLLSIELDSAKGALCEPSENWKSFSDYWTAVNCTNSTEIEKPCDRKCGPAQNISSATNLKIDEGGSEDENEEKVSEKQGITVSYETDAKKNAAAAKKVCKTTTCQLDCCKPIISKKCGAKAYDMYVRMQKLEHKSSLNILKKLKAIESVEECKTFE